MELTYLVAKRELGNQTSSVGRIQYAPCPYAEMTHADNLVFILIQIKNPYRNTF